MATQASAVGDRRFTGDHTIVQWAADLIATINAQSNGKYHIPVNATTLSILVTWADHETGGSQIPGWNNPLNTIEKSQGGVAGEGGTQGNITIFSSYQSGLANQAYNLVHSPASFGYAPILAGLQAANPGQVFAAITNSSFGTHFGSSVKLEGTGTTVPTGTAATSSGGGGSTATTDSSVTSSIGNALGTILGPGILAPFGGIGNPLGALEGAGKATSALATTVLGVIANWRYVAEVLIGLGMVGVGLLLIVHDTGADKKAVQAGKTAGEVAAVAA